MPDFAALATWMVASEQAGLDDTALLDRLNTPVKLVDPRPVPVPEIESLSIRRGVTPRLYVAADSTPTTTAEATARALARTVLHLFGATHLVVIHTDDAASGQLLDGLAAAGILTTDDRAAVLALADQYVAPSAAVWGVPVTTQADLDNARAGRF